MIHADGLPAACWAGSPFVPVLSFILLFGYWGYLLFTIKRRKR